VNMPAPLKGVPLAIGGAFIAGLVLGRIVSR
jgi:hypothetical protein